MDYNFPAIEEKWQKHWKENKTFKVENSSDKPKFYVLDMFPYPSGAGLHVGHPLGYIASDIYTRYKRLEGFNVLHPMGFDAFGLPAEQYAIQTGQHPAITTDTNIKRYKEQLEKIGFAYDWDREVRTCDPKYYKWTQWVFVKLFNHWYNNESNKAEPIEKLIAEFELNGNQKVNAAHHCELSFSSSEWKQMSEKEQQETLLCYRLAFLAETLTNWCPALGTVLANDEIKDGFSVRGGHPVEQKKMKQWCLRITAYSERLLNGLDSVDWTESLKDMQRNWIGKSEGAQIKFKVQSSKLKVENTDIFVFTTRPDTIFGVTFMVLAPEHELVSQITIPEQRAEVEAYLAFTKKRTERERMTEVNKVSGCFTGSYAIHPFSGKQIPVWISEYVLAGYGTGAIMAVPAHDSRDFAFARHFNLSIPQVIMKEGETPADTSTWEESYDAKDGICINSEFIDGLSVSEGAKTIIHKIEEIGIGKRMINYRLRDAIFSRQRYWGEPFPVYYKDGIPYCLDENKLPLELPEIESFLPTEDGQSPLGRAKNWKTEEGYPYEMSTMPGFAGSSGYYFRYMDPQNNNEYFSKDIVNYWQDVDLYIGGTEHATGHLIYARFWCKFLYDMGLVPKEEPFKKLINQGMISGVSEYIHSAAPQHLLNAPGSNQYNYIFCNEIVKELDSIAEVYYSSEIANTAEKELLAFEKSHKGNVLRTKIYSFNIPSNYTHLHILKEFQKFKKWRRPDPIFNGNMIFVCKHGFWKIDINNNVKWIAIGENNEPEDFFTTPTVEKMSKSKLNVVTPDNSYDSEGNLEQEGIIEKYGADTLRLYEMFLGPLEQSKPWDTNGIEGVHRFFRKFWKLYHNSENVFYVTDDEPTNQELKALHKLIKKVKEDIEGFSFNTSVSAFMICVNELGDLKCNKKAILEPLAIVLSPFAPHIAEEMWEMLGHTESILNAGYPAFDESYLKENTKSYPVSFNGKVRFQLELSLDLDAVSIEKAAMENEQTARWLEGKTPRKVIVVPGKIINIVY